MSSKPKTSPSAAQQLAQLEDLVMVECRFWTGNDKDAKLLESALYDMVDEQEDSASYCVAYLTILREARRNGGFTPEQERAITAIRDAKAALDRAEALHS